MIHTGDRLSAFLDGELPAEREEEVRVHLSVCRACREELAEVQEARSALRSLPFTEVPFPVDDVLVRGAQRRRSRVRALAAAVTAAAVMAGIVLASDEPPPQLDLAEIAGQHTARAALDPAATPVRLVVSVSE